MTAGMLHFGLRLKGYEFRNEVGLNFEKKRLGFAGHGMAFTDAGLFASFFPARGLSLEVQFTSDLSGEPRFRSLFSIANGNRNDQLIIGQWGRSLMLMNGDDFSNRRLAPKIYLPLNPGQNTLVVISGLNGTSVYLNHKLVRQRRDFVLTLPENLDTTRMVLGNNIFGTDPWIGEVAGFRLWNQLIKSDQTDIITPYLELLVQGSAGLLLKGSEEATLNIPDFKPLLYPSYLRPPESEDSFQTFVFDVFLNFFGFIPLGAVVYLLVIRFNGQAFTRAVLISVAAGFLLSLIIETAQIWLPSRVSSLHDLLLNSLGALAGGILLFRAGKD